MGAWVSRWGSLGWRAWAGIVLVVLAVAAAGGCRGSRPIEPPQGVPPIELVGSATIPTDAVFEGTRVGGLSGLTYDAASGRFLAISDDRGELAPARFYELGLELTAGRLAESGVRVVGVTTLRGRDGQPFARRSIDAEGIAILGDGTVMISSEGDAATGALPFVGRFARDGAEIERLALPAHILPRLGGAWGVRDNLALESLTVTPDESHLVTTTENALEQDGPAADLATGSLARVLWFSWPDGAPAREYVYPVAPVPIPPTKSDGFRTNGLPDLLALDSETFLALERASATGVGYSVRLFLTSLAGATDVSGIPSLSARGVPPVRPMRKRLLLDLGTLGIKVQNLEGMAFGPMLADGRQVLVMVADNNFGRRGELTQVLAFAVDRARLRATPIRRPAIAEIQGARHASVFFGEEVAAVSGVVTAVLDRGPERGFWMQSVTPDGDDRTSEGLFVLTDSAMPAVAVGDRVRVDGVVEEPIGGLGLPVTRLVATAVEVAARGLALPAPVEIGPNGRRPPQDTIDDDALTRFEPETDGLDFFESLEGMRVAVPRPVVVGPTSRFGELVVLPDGLDGERTERGGLRIAPGRFNPHRVMISGRLLPAVPDVVVGDRFDGALVGVLDYSFGSYKVVLTEPLPEVIHAALAPPVTALAGAPDRLSIATFNVENLALTSSEDKLARVATVIATNLRGPDVVALQEIQDDSGPADDGVTTARGTLTRLVEAIAVAGGPSYAFRQIDPENNRDGGAPGANIRVALLFNPQRVGFVDRGEIASRDAARVVDEQEGLALFPSPGRVEPASPAWGFDSERGHEASRKPLAGELTFGGRRLFVVVVHLRSKGGDAPLFGRVQPPTLPSERQRIAQAEVVSAFVGQILSHDPEAAVVVLGDFNEFEFAPPLAAFESTPLVNLVERLDATRRYSFVFQGNSQVLDHILVSPSLAGAAEIESLHLNADLPDALRASDHDPLVAVVGF